MSRNLFVCLCAFALPLATGWTEAPVDLANTGFENGLEGWTVAEPDEAMSSVTADAAHEGQAGLRVEDNSGEGAARVLSAEIPVAPGEVYRLRFWARTETPNAMAVSLRFNSADGRAIDLDDPYLRLVNQGDGQWVEYTLDAIAPDNAVSLMLWIASFSRMTGLVDFDDFSLEKLDPESAQAREVAEAAAALAAASERPLREGPPKIIIKADDLRAQNGRIHRRWMRFIDFIQERGIKAGIGIIGNSLDGDNPQYVQAVKDFHATGLFEFWNHGYDHLEWEEDGVKVYEFKGSSYEHQKQHLVRTNELAREKLDLVFRTFGAPYAVSDENTAKVLEEDADIQVMLYGKPLAKGDPVPKDVVVLDRLWDVNIESPLFVPNLEKLKAGMANYPDRDYFVIQGHPSRWDEERFAEFVKIIDHLIAEGAEFVTPSEYAESEIAADNSSANLLTP